MGIIDLNNTAKMDAFFRAEFLSAALLAAITLLLGSSDATAKMPRLTKIEIEAPFEMPPISVPDFSQSPRFDITEFGAKQNDKASASKAIAAAIERAHSAGGGVVVIPEGKWLTKKIHLKSNVNLHLSTGALLRFSEDPGDYLPAVKTTWEGMECYNYSPLIYAYDCQNIAITGSGQLEADLAVWKIWYARPEPHMQALKRLYEMASTGVPVEERQMAVGQANMRPQFIQFNRCKNVLLEDVTIRNSPFWVIHPFLSTDIVIRGVKVNARGHNNDGVDPEMSQNVLIEDCEFNQGDDAISVKSGRNQDAWRLDTPSKNIVVRNCRVKHGHQLMAIGSELSGGVENVLVENCQVDKRLVGVGHLLYIKTNERRGGYARNIHMRNVTAGDLRYGPLGIETDVLYQWRKLVPTYEVRLTPISNIYMENVRAGKVKYLTKIDGQDSLPVRNVKLTEVEVEGAGQTTLNNKNVEGFQLESHRLGSVSTTRE